MANTAPLPRTAIIGAGISGIGMAVKLQQAGLPFVLFEKAASIGGTWRDNAYPGLRCDVPGYVYTYSFARDPISPRLLPRGPEIRDYLQRVFETHRLRSVTRFEREIVQADWRDGAWTLRTQLGEEDRFDAVVHATGYLHHPSLPNIPGREDFAGATVHSARWDPELQWEGKRVGVIGNGSTGVQLVGAMAGKASHLSTFQRTPQWVFPLPNVRVPRGLSARLARSPRFTRFFVEMLERIADWFLGTASTRPGLRRRLFGRIARAYLGTVEDPQLRARLTPPDEPLCKRPVIDTRFYRAVQRDDVSVVTTDIERIVAQGVVTTDGTTHPLDVLVFATGFQPHAYMRPMRITGRDGITLDDAWKDGPRAYRTMAIPGFPNMFIMLGPHSPLLAVSIHSTVERQAEHILQLVELLRAGRAAAVEPTAEAMARWVQEIRDGVTGTIWDSDSCNSWYLGADRLPILWPFKRARWYRTLRLDLDDYALHPPRQG